LTAPTRGHERPGPHWRPGRRLLVLGVGSTLRRDDAIGPAVAEALAASPLPGGVACRPVHGLVPELAVDLEAVDDVWFVDAAADPALERPTWARVVGAAASGGGLGAAVGAARRGATPEAAKGAAGGHALDPAALLAWTEAWCGRAPDAWTLALPAEDFGFGEGWSARGARSIEAALRDLRWRLGP
jgi:hydrogenase maturation protease